MASGVLRQYVAAGAALLCVVSSATCFAWVTPILVGLLSPESEVPMTESEASWMIAIIELGNLISPIPAGMLADRWGRKTCILATGPAFLITWIIVLTTNTVEALYVARVLQGTAMGFMFTLVPVYLAEISSPGIRGTIMCGFMVAWYVGYLFEYIVGPLLSYRMFTAVTAVWPVLQTLMFFWQPESPHYLLMRGRNQEAKQSLSSLRMLPPSDQAVLDELEEIRTSLKAMEETSSWISLLKSKTDRKNLFVVFLVSFVAILSGGYGVLTYSSHMFTSTQTTFLKPDNITIMIGVFLFTASLVSSGLVDKLGRRPLLLISTIGCTLSLTTATVYFYFQELNTYDMSPYFWTLLVSLVFYFVSWAFGLLPIYVTYQSELFSSSTRGTASSIIAIVITVFAFVSLKFYSPISEMFGYCTLFGCYSVISLAGVVIIYFVAPETKGKSLLEIQNANKKSDSSNIQELSSSLLRIN